MKEEPKFTYKNSWRNPLGSKTLISSKDLRECADKMDQDKIAYILPCYDHEDQFFVWEARALETEEEKAQRISREQEYKLAVEKGQYENYLKLKEKYENSKP